MLIQAAEASWEALSLPESVVTANVLAEGRPLATLYSLKRSAQRSVVLRASLPAALAAAPPPVGPSPHMSVGLCSLETQLTWSASYHRAACASQMQAIGRSARWRHTRCNSPLLLLEHARLTWLT